MAEILQYVHKDSPFHRLHPVTKIAFVIGLSLVSILTLSIPLLLGIILVLIIVAVASRLHREVFKQFVLIVVMSIIFIVITLLTLPAGEVIGYLIPDGIPLIGGSLPITTGALEFGVILTLRFTVLITAFQLFVISTQPRDLIHTLEKMHIPTDYILMFLIALRFIPTLQIEGVRIHEAQLARGYRPGTGFTGKIRSVAPVVIPLVSNSLVRANVLGLTIDLRGYRAGRRTPLRERVLGRADYAVFVLIAIFLAGYISSTVLRLI